MIDKTALKKTLFLFNRESNRLMSSDWEDSPAPFQRFLDYIEGEPEIKSYLDECLENHTPEGFDAAEDVKAVAKDFGVTFVNFSTIPEEESAEIYLILKQIVAQNIDGRSRFFHEYASGNHYADKYKGFLNKVVRRLITNIDEHLTLMGFEIGLDNSMSATNNFYGDVQNAQINQPASGATVNAAQANGLNANEVEALLNKLISAAEVEVDDAETIEDLRDNVGIVREQIKSGKPKHGIIKSFVGFLSGVNGGAQFAAAVCQIIEFFNSNGFHFPLPS